jgi:hypothetical protein
MAARHRVAKHLHRSLAEHHADLAAHHADEHEHHSELVDHHADHHEHHAAMAEHHGALAARKKRKAHHEHLAVGGHAGAGRHDRRPRSSGSDHHPFSSAARRVDVARTTTNIGDDTEPAGKHEHHLAGGHHQAGKHGHRDHPGHHFKRGGMVGERLSYNAHGSNVERAVWNDHRIDDDEEHDE